MADILIRDLDKSVIDRLKRRARDNGRSLQREAKLLLEQAAAPDHRGVAALLEKWQQRFAGRKLARSRDIIRRDRAR